MELQKPGNSPRPGREILNRKKIVKRRVAQIIHSWTAQNEMRSPLGGMTADAASRVLNSAYFREVKQRDKDKGLTEGSVYRNEHEREH